jgi:ABC-type tungstate transport system permease subunit
MLLEHGLEMAEDQTTTRESERPSFGFASGVDVAAVAVGDGVVAAVAVAGDADVAAAAVAPWWEVWKAQTLM